LELGLELFLLLCMDMLPMSVTRSLANKIMQQERRREEKRTFGLAGGFLLDHELSLVIPFAFLNGFELRFDGFVLKESRDDQNEEMMKGKGEDDEDGGVMKPAGRG